MAAQSQPIRLAARPYDSTTLAPAVRDDLNKAVALYHSFWFPEAIKVSNRSPSAIRRVRWCIGNCHEPVGQPVCGTEERGDRAARKSHRRQGPSDRSPTPRERGLIEAVGMLYSSPDPATHRDRVARYEEAMRQVAADNPRDIELRIFYALAVTQSALPTDKTYAKLLQAADILEPLFKQMPTHPGLTHYIIHATTRRRWPRGPRCGPPLCVARAGGAHALHMPSHTFTRLGFWNESIDTNRKSAETARKISDPNAELHALDYQTYAYLQTGRDGPPSPPWISPQRPDQPGFNTFAAAAIPARYAVERGDWAAAAKLTVQPAANTPYTEAMTHFARAIGAARSGRPDPATADITRIGELRDKLQSMQDAYWAEQVGIQRRVAVAWQTFAAGRRDEGLAQLRAAADTEDATDKAAVTPGPLARRARAARIHAPRHGQVRDALVAFDPTMKKEPNRFRGAYGDSPRGGGGRRPREGTNRNHGHVLQIAREADTDWPELAAARKAVKRQLNHKVRMYARESFRQTAFLHRRGGAHGRVALLRPPRSRRVPPSKSTTTTSAALSQGPKALRRASG